MILAPSPSSTTMYKNKFDLQPEIIYNIEDFSAVKIVFSYLNIKNKM